MKFSKQHVKIQSKMSFWKHVKTLDLKITFSDNENMSKGKFKKLVKEKTSLAAIDHLIAQKFKQTKIKTNWIWKDGATGIHEYTHFKVYSQGQGENIRY